MNVDELTQKKYITALYLRLSSEDGDKDESESISNQRKILRSYAKENGYIIYDEYVDDGYSGTNFDRPDFKRMINDIENKKINMVITKSLSRLGRDYIETGRLIEKYFPENNIRYIALLDDVDTLLDSSTDFVALKNLMNDFYAKETSKNVKKTKNRKREKDNFYYISVAPYGYRKIDIKGNIEIYESEAKVVRKIFKEFMEGKGTYQIAKQLTKEGILTPGLSMQMKGATTNQTKATKIWDCTQVRRILINPIYIGTTVQNKTRKISYKSKKKIRNDLSEYIYNENHHEPIINITTWNTVQRILNSKENTKIRKEDELLKPFLYCHHCHNKLSIIHRKRYLKHSTKTDTYITCSTAYRKKTNRICYHQYNTYHLVEEKVLKNIFNTITEYLSANAFNSKEALAEMISLQQGKQEIDEKIEKLSKELDTINKKIQLLYQDRLNGIIEENDFSLFFEGLKTERDKIETYKKELEDDLIQYMKQDTIRSIEEDIKSNMEKIAKTEEITKEDLYSLVRRIEIDKDKNIIIEYNFWELNFLGEKVENVKTGS